MQWQLKTNTLTGRDPVEKTCCCVVPGEYGTYPYKYSGDNFINRFEFGEDYLKPQ